MRFLAALSFLTIIPLPRRREASPEEIGRSIVYFPVVGLIIGLILIALSGLLRFVLPSPVVNALLIVLLVIITGALHLDGFIDTCDGIAGHKPVEARWQVMHDSRSGAFGVVGAVLLLLLKYVTLNSILLPLTVVALMPVLSRWAMVYAVFAYPYARPEGLGKVIKQGANWVSFSIATATTLALALGIVWLTGISQFYLVAPVIMLGVWVIIVIVASYFKRMFAGLTGDNYGAINEIAEVGVLILVALLAYNQWFN